MSYDASERLTSIVGSKGTTTLTKFTYAYLQAGVDRALRQSVTDKDNDKTSSTYDKLNRLTQAQTKNSLGTITSTYAYEYDPNSNRTKQTINGTVTSYEHNAADQLCWSLAGTSTNVDCTAPAGATTYSYDLNGNETATAPAAPSPTTARTRPPASPRPPGPRSR